MNSDMHFPKDETLLVPSPLGVRLTMAAGIATNLALLALLSFFVSKKLFYDEPWYLSTVALLDQHGLTADFLRALPGPAGPLYTLVHGALAPLTGLTPPGVRFVNVGFLGGTIVALFGILRLDKSANPLVSALSFTAAPMIWVVTGIALTEMAATFFSVLALGFLWSALGGKSTWYSLLLAAMGGLCLGLAILGRQPLLVLLVPLPLFAIYDFRLASRVILFVIISLILPAMVFTVWRGLVPPRTGYVGDGIAPMHGLLAFTYAGCVMLVWSPAWFQMNFSFVVTIIAISCLGNAVVGFGQYEALHSLAIRFISPQMMPIYGRLVWGGLVSLGLIFLFAQVRHTWDRRKDVKFVFLSVVVLLLLLSSMKITHLFSSRYVVSALPPLLLLAEPFTVAGRNKAFRILLGGVIGAVALYGYYQT